MSYETIFAARGSRYDRAMQRWPDARAEDFLVPLAWLAPTAGETVLDVPAGGGYLARHLPAGCRWLGHEPCAGFGAAASGPPAAELLPLPCQDVSVDAAISIAGVHHLDDKRPLYRELRRVVRPGGRLLLADVHEDSAVARFLDGFVGCHNTTGHSGHYLGPRTLAELDGAGWRVRRAERVGLAWLFDDRAALVAFCRMLFDMPAVPDAELLGAVDRVLGCRARGGRVAMAWELFLVLAEAA